MNNNNNIPKTETRIKFYADSDTDTNKYFVFTFNELYPKEAIFRQFAQGLTIRALWVEKIYKETGEVISNVQIETLEELWKEFLALPERERRKYYPKKQHRFKRSL